MMIVILDMGWGNLGALQQYFRRFDDNVLLSGYSEINFEGLCHDILVWPGVGSAEQFSDISPQGRHCLERAYNVAAKNIAICLGFQFLFGQHDEGGIGLGIFPQGVQKMKTHNIGYGRVGEGDYYFNHRYGVVTSDEFENYSSTFFHDESGSYLALMRNERLLGCQFHPEKSRGAGLSLVRDFLCLD